MERYAHLPEINGLDGPHTVQSQRLAKLLRTETFALNLYWILTPTYWTCPCCQREKSSIARNKGGALLGQLVSHHDHMTDWVTKRHEELVFTGEWPQSGRSTKPFVERLHSFISSFDPCVICADCNEAEAMGKDAAGIGKLSFSFSPLEIRKFINPKSNAAHGVLGHEAVTLWKAAETNFRARADLGENIIRMALNGCDWYQPMPGTTAPNHTMKVAELAFERGLDRAFECDITDFDKYVDEVQRTMKRTKDLSAWRAHPRRKLGKPPSDEDLRRLASIGGTGAL